MIVNTALEIMELQKNNSYIGVVGGDLALQQRLFAFIVATAEAQAYPEDAGSIRCAADMGEELLRYENSLIRDRYRIPYLTLVA